MSASDWIIRILTAVTVVALGAVAAVVSYSHALDVALSHGQGGVTAHLTPLTVDGLVLVSGMVMLDAARRGRRAPVLSWATLALGIGATLGVNVLYGAAYGPVGAIVAGWPAVALVLSSELLMGLIRRGQVGTLSPGVNELTPAQPERVRSLDELMSAANVVSAIADTGLPAPSNEGQARELARVPEAVFVAPAEDSGLFPVATVSVTDATADPLLATARQTFAEALATGSLPSVRQLRLRLKIGHPRAVRLREALSVS